MMSLTLTYIVGLGPYVLLAIAAGFVMAGFTPWLWKHPERWLFWAILVLSFNPTAGNPTADGSIVREVTWSALFLLVAALLILGKKKPLSALAKLVPKGLAILVAWLIVSIAWSPEPFISFKRVIQIIGVLLIGLLVARNTLKGHSLQRQLQPSAMFFIFVGLAAAVLFPSIAFDTEHSFTGVSAHKNVWGTFSLIASLIFLLSWLTNRKNGWLLLLGVIPSVVSLVLTKSTTSLVSFVFISGAIPVWMLASSKGVAGKMSLIFATMLIALIFLVYLVFTGDWPLDALSDSIYSLTGKDQTLTGRKFLWQLMFVEIQKHPWLGTGYGGFWTNGPGPSATLVSRLNWGPPVQAHNGYIDIVNETGLVGLLMLLGVLAVHMKNILKLLHNKDTYIGIFHAAILFSALLINYAESSLLRTTHIVWILLCASNFEVYALTHTPAVDALAQGKSRVANM